MKGFWDDEQNRLLLQNKEIVEGMNLAWWFFCLNAVPDEIVGRLRQHIRAQYEATPELLDYYKHSVLAEQCRAFLKIDV